MKQVATSQNVAFEWRARSTGGDDARCLRCFPTLAGGPTAAIITLLRLQEIRFISFSLDNACKKGGTVEWNLNGSKLE